MKKLLLICFMLISLQGWSQGQFQQETTGSLGFFSGQIMQLAEATPEEVYDWTPMEGVRSFGEVIGHIVGGNYFFATQLGATLPEGVNMETLQDDLKTKAQLKAALTQSFALISDTIKGISDDDLTTKVTFPFGEFSKMGASLIVLNHASEHLGQMIAYARSNEIVPPWSQPAAEE